MDNESFREQVETNLKPLDRRQTVFFAWLCAVRALPFIGVKGQFNYWQKEDRPQHLYAIFRALDISNFYITGRGGSAAADTARAAAYASYGAAAFAADAAAAAAFAAAADTAYGGAGTAFAAGAAAAVGAGTAYAYAAAGARAKLQKTILSDIQIIQKGEHKFENNLDLYGKIWNNFQTALEKEGCKYWGELYEGIFKRNFVFSEQDKEALERRINVPKEIREQGAAAVASYLEQIEKYKEDILYEGKILIVGEAGAGKTTLFRKLEKPKLKKPDTKSTLGVIVKEGLRLPHPTIPKVKMLANLWDFGGQEIQYNLHQYFITSDALFILVSDNRKQNTQWDYWFHIIELLAGKCPVLVVLNNNATISTKSDFEITKYSERFKSLNFISPREVDLTKNDYQWKHLQEEVFNSFSKLPLVNYSVPAPWVELREGLLKMREGRYGMLKIRKEPRNYIFLKEFYKLETHYVLSKEEKKSALNYFTKIGIVTHFPEDDKLKDYIFLNPNWITQGLYAAIDSGNKELDNGKFTKEWIFDFWSKHENKYDEDEQSFLLSLMLKDNFDICYELDKENKTYVIPFLLPEKQPDSEEINWIHDDNIGIRIQYPFMPKGILSRLIVQLNERIESNPKTKKQLVWRDGVILDDKKHGCRAKVTSDYDSQSGLKYIDIRVCGTTSNFRREFLQLVLNKIEDIHSKSFKRIKPTELVCCNCKECKVSIDPHFFKMETIETWLKKGKDDIDCEKSAETVDIDELIGPVYSNKEIEKMKSKEKEKEGSMINIEFSGDNANPNIAIGKKSKISQKTTTNKNTFNFHNCNVELQGDLTVLASTLKRKDETEEAEALEEAAKAFSEAEQCKTPEDVQKKGIVKILKRIVDEFADETSNLHKTVKGIKTGIGIAQDIAQGYNDIAQWCGLPQVPKPFLKKEESQSKNKP